MKINIIIISLTFILFSTTSQPIDFDAVLDKKPLITIDRTEKGKFKSVTIYEYINAPFELVWDTIKNIKSYPEYMERIERLEIIENNMENNYVIVEWEIEVPFFNMEYQLKYNFDKKNREIRIKRHKGSLEGSTWLWKFENYGKKTLVIYSGTIKNYSALFESFDDEMQTMTVGVNLSTLAATVKSIKDRSEFLFGKRKSGSGK